MHSFQHVFYFLLVYFSGKPNPWGIKVWCAAHPKSGYMLGFDVYLESVANPIPHGLGIMW